MLTLLFAKLNPTDVNEPTSILYLAAAELLIFDAPMIVILFVMWKGIFIK